eukprot:COSAG01_NODE_1660_length_9588_cov_458.469175_13_plen_37_part_00
MIRLYMYEEQQKMAESLNHRKPVIDFYDLILMITPP